MSWQGTEDWHRGCCPSPRVTRTAPCLCPALITTVQSCTTELTRLGAVLGGPRSRAEAFPHYRPGSGQRCLVWGTRRCCYKFCGSRSIVGSGRSNRGSAPCLPARLLQAAVELPAKQLICACFLLAGSCIAVGSWVVVEQQSHRHHRTQLKEPG